LRLTAPTAAVVITGHGRAEATPPFGLLCPAL